MSRHSVSPICTVGDIQFFILELEFSLLDGAFFVLCNSIWSFNAHDVCS